MKPRDGEGVPVAPKADAVFSLAIGPACVVWKVRVNGTVLPYEWPDRGSAQAGLEAELRRRAVRQALMEEK